MVESYYAAMNFEFVESRKGAALIYFENYLFKKEKQYRNGSVAYVCRNTTCKVRGTFNDNHFSIKSGHDHPCEDNNASDEEESRSHDKCYRTAHNLYEEALHNCFC